MEQPEKTVLMKLELGEDLHRSLAEHCARTGETVDQAISKILRSQLGIAEDAQGEPVPLDSLEWTVPLDSLEWTVLIPYARRMRMGLRFNLYDLVVRMHSERGLATLKIPGFWHSAFVQWVRRNEEFQVIPAKNGNLFERISDEHAPLPKTSSRKARDAGAVRRMTQAQLQDAVREMAACWRMGELFTVDMLLGQIDKKTRPLTVGYGFYSRFNTWAKDTNCFHVASQRSPRNHYFNRRAVVQID